MVARKKMVNEAFNEVQQSVVRNKILELLATCGGRIDSNNGLATRLIYANLNLQGELNNEYGVRMLLARMVSVEKLLTTKRKHTRTYFYALTAKGNQRVEQLGFKKGSFKLSVPHYYKQNELVVCEYCGRRMRNNNLSAHVAAHVKKGDVKPKVAPEAWDGMKPRKKKEEKPGAVKADAPLELPATQDGLDLLAVRVFNLIMANLAKLGQPAGDERALQQVMKENTTLSDRLRAQTEASRQLEKAKSAADAEVKRLQAKFETAEKNIDTLMKRVKELSGEAERLKLEAKARKDRPAPPATTLGDIVSPEAKATLQGLLNKEGGDA